MSEEKAYYAVKKFHEVFGHPVREKPTKIPVDIAIKRAIWTGEELVEFLHASVGGDVVEFFDAMEEFQKGIDAAIQKQIKEGNDRYRTSEDILVGQMDALTDISYFNNGSFVVAGVDPEPLFNIVQRANMGKLGEDGKPIVRESDGKTMKPPHWEENFAPEPRLRKEIQRQSRE